jgi:hypothetical protein
MNVAQQHLGCGRATFGFLAAVARLDARGKSCFPLDSTPQPGTIQTIASRILAVESKTEPEISIPDQPLLVDLLTIGCKSQANRRKSIAQGLKPTDFIGFMARLKSCPFTKQELRGFFLSQ